LFKVLHATPFIKINSYAFALKLQALTGRYQMTLQDKSHNSTLDFD